MDFYFVALHKVFGSLYQDEIQIEAGEAVSLMAAATLLQLVCIFSVKCILRTFDLYFH